MPSERIQRQIDRLLDEAERAFGMRDWTLLRAHALDVLKLDAGNDDALMFLTAADQGLADVAGSVPSEAAGSAKLPTPALSPPDSLPSSFASGRYAVKKFLGEGGKKRVYLAHDSTLDRDVAFALIKTDGLDDIARERIAREAQAMGRLGAHPHIVTVFDLGDEGGQPFMVTEPMGGGDVEGAIEHAPEHKLPLPEALTIAEQVCQGLEFAHAKGIVHRDLKPGNVWLTADGVAKIGDFGLAVAIDRTRLTQAGMMVGTVSYMPPEQATGGEVTPRSDLYSLGAMLYELVTGRPPFVGDEAVAILSQHLNVTAVAPAWHRPDCPYGLEALILRLLEKDPSKRPESATEVCAALASIVAGVASPAAGLPRRTGDAADGSLGATEPTDNPMYRRTFVGREQELKQLHSAYDAAISGQGSLVMVVGEPGIGKTSITEQLATYATVRGGRTLVGHCYEEGSLSLPYLPFVEALRSYVLAREPDALRKDLGSGASEVARIVSEVRDQLRIEPSAPTADPEEERYRLFQAVTAFLRNAATVQPLVIVLEDLHDADRGTLELLLHLSRALAGSRLLLAGTYRDIEVDRAHPLSSTLAELRRSAGFSRVLLRGLTADEVQRMLSSISGQEVRWELAEAVHRQTEGNPLFVQEVLRYLVEEGLIKREGGRWRPSGDTPLVASIPKGLRDVIGKRLQRLSPECNRLLSVASVIGRDFTLATLQGVAGVEQDALVEAMEEARRVAVLTEQARVGSVQYRFAHAFFRQTLYEELGAARRLRLHQDVARVLEEQYAGRLEEHAAELAEHFTQSTDPADLAKAVRYSELAAARAQTVYAYGEAARHLEQALDVQEVLEPNDKAKQCDLLLALGESLMPGGEVRRVAEAVAPAAFSLAQEAGDRRKCFASARLALLGTAYIGAGASLRTEAFRRWAEECDHYAESGTADRVWADIHLGQALWVVGRNRDGLALGHRALALAQKLGPEDLILASSVLLSAPLLPEHADDNFSLAVEVEHIFLRGAAPIGPLQVSRVGVGLALLSHGERARAERLWQIAMDEAERTRDARAAAWAMLGPVIRSTVDGRFDDAVEAGRLLQARATDLGTPVLGERYAAASTRAARIYSGRAAEVMEGMTPNTLAGEAGWHEGMNPRRSVEAGLCYLQLGQRDEAAAVLAGVLGELAPDEMSIIVLCWLLEIATWLDDRAAIAELLPRLAPASGLISVRVGTIGPVVARELGAAAAVLGEHVKARDCYRQAIGVCEKVRFRPEMALTRLQLAEVLLEHYPAERAEAAEHLAFAISEFRDMKMQPSLERALRHKEVLKA